MKLRICIMLLILATILCVFTSCNDVSSDPNEPLFVILPPYSGTEISSKCLHQITEIIYLSDTGESIFACSLCGNSEQGYHYYYQKSNDNLYTRHEKIIIKLNSQYRGETLFFRADVNEVILIGTEGQTLDEFQIYIQNRKNPFTISLYDVSVISKNSIIVSPECSETVIIKTYGSTSSLVTFSGKNGEHGELVYAGYGTSQYANSGASGEDANHVIDVLGNVEVFAYAPISVIGGNGGIGGNGASHQSGPQYFADNDGGNGGPGGNGGDAIHTGGRAYIYANESYVTLQGGYGGRGGYGGTGGTSIYGSKDGTNGQNGQDGKTGLQTY